MVSMDQLCNRNLSRTRKLIFFKTLILPVLLCSSEAWILLSTDVAVLRVFERKVLRKTFGPVRVGDDFRIRYNSKLYELLNDMDVVQRINIQPAALAQPCRSYGGGCSGQAGIYGSPVIDWCDQLAQACKKQRHLEGCVGRK